MMRDCPDAAMRDLLPDFVHGTLPAGDRVRVAEHVAGCADCAAEAGLIRSAHLAFGAAMPRVDVSRIVAALPLASSVPVARWGLSMAWRIAAAFALVALGSLSVVVLRGAFSDTPLAANRPAASDSAPAGSGLDERPAAKQVRVAPRAVEIAAAAPEGLSFGGGLSDLTDEQLQVLLREIDGLQATPTVEPEVHATPILPPREGGTHAT